jgi:hypothetical protein
VDYISSLASGQVMYLVDDKKKKGKAD